MRATPLVPLALLALLAGCGSAPPPQAGASPYVITLRVEADGVVRDEPLSGRSPPQAEVRYQAELATVHIRERGGAEQELTAALTTVVVRRSGEVLLGERRVAEQAEQVSIDETGAKGSRRSGRPAEDVASDVGHYALGILVLAGAILIFGLLVASGGWPSFSNPWGPD